MHTWFKVVVIIALGCSACLSIIASQAEDPNKRAQREHAQREVEKCAQRAVQKVRDNEPGWKLEKRFRAFNYASNDWKKDDEFADSFHQFYETIEKTKEGFRNFATQVGPIKTESVPNLGDDAVLLVFPGHTYVRFRKGQHIVIIRASSVAIAKRFAKYYDESIVVDK